MSEIKKQEGIEMSRIKLTGIVIVLTVVVSTMAGNVRLSQKLSLNLDVAKNIAAASAAFAAKNDWNVVIAIVDDGGHLLYFERMDGVQLGSIQIAIEKAETAVWFKRPSAKFERGVEGGRNVLLALPNGIPFEGGVPILWEGEIIGAVGVSGVTAQQDGMVAQAGADALTGIVGE